MSYKDLQATRVYRQAVSNRRLPGRVWWRRVLWGLLLALVVAAMWVSVFLYTHRDRVHVTRLRDLEFSISPVELYSLRMWTHSCDAKRIGTAYHIGCVEVEVDSEDWARR